MKSTKKSFLLSVLSLLLCVTMLAGSTFAWFTDSVASGTNKIVAGNLDIDVLHTNAKITTAETIEGKTNLFTDVNGEAMLWEPGAISYENFTVKNLGTLALKYKLAMNITDYNGLNGHSLKEVLKVKVLTDTDIIADVTRTAVEALDWSTTATLDVFNTAGELLAAEADEFQVIVYWKPTANDDLYNVKNGATTSDGQPLFIDFGINVVASQYNSESDSFDSDYDKGIVLPDLPVSINKTFKSEKITNKNISTENVIVKNESTGDGVATMPKAAAETVVDTLAAQVLDKKADTDTETVIYLDVKTVEKSETAVTYQIELSAVMTYTDTNDQTKTKELDNLDGYMGNQIITAEMNIGKGLSNVTVKHNTSAMSALSSASADAEGFYYDKATGTLTIKSKSFSPFTIDYTIDAEAFIGEKVYAYFAEAAAAAQEGDVIVLLADITGAPTFDKAVTIVLNGHTYEAASSIAGAGYGVKVENDKYLIIPTWSAAAATEFATAVDTQNKIVTIANAAELALFANTIGNYQNYTVKLTANIDLSGKIWTPMSAWNGTFDGQGYTISGLYVNADNKYGNGFFSYLGNSGTAIMKNVTFDGALVQRGMGQYSGNMYGIIAGYAAYYGSVYFENVTVQNSTVWGFGKVGAFFGMAEAQGGTVSFKGCNVSNVTVKSGYNGGGYAGLIQYAVSGDRNTVIFDNCAEPTVTFVTCGIMRDGAESVKVGTLDGFYTVWGGNAYYADTAKYYNLFACPEADRAVVDAIVCDDARNLEGTTWVDHAADAFSVIDTEAKTITITNAAELARVSKVAKTLTGYTVTLGANIDLAAYEWDPIAINYNTAFVFDGANYTISDLHVNTTKSDIGLFGNATGATIKNVKMANVNIIACQRVGAICGQMIAGSIDNCTVTNAVITAAPIWDWAEQDASYAGGAKAGAIAGYLSNSTQAPATNCTVENATVTAYRDAGGVVGYAQGAVDLSGATVTNTTVTLVSVTPYETTDGAAPSANVGTIYGRFDSANAPITTGSTVTNVTVTPAN